MNPYTCDIVPNKTIPISSFSVIRTYMYIYHLCQAKLNLKLFSSDSGYVNVAGLGVCQIQRRIKEYNYTRNSAIQVSGFFLSFSVVYPFLQL